MRRVLHVVRDPAGGPPAEALADHDWVVYEFLDGWRLADRGAPPLPIGSIDDAQLLDLAAAADAVIVW